MESEKWKAIAALLSTFHFSLSLLFGSSRINVPGMASEKSVFDVHREKLEDHEMMMGPIRGKLAVLLDLLTDSMIVAGKHSIYCKGRRSGEASPDMEAIAEGLVHSKELVQALMDHFRKQN